MGRRLSKRPSVTILTVLVYTVGEEELKTTQEFKRVYTVVSCLVIFVWVTFEVGAQSGISTLP